MQALFCSPRRRPGAVPTWCAVRTLPPASQKWNSSSARCR